MPPRSVLAYSLRGGSVIPRFLEEVDHPWLRALLDEWERFVGRPQRELHQRMREPLGVPAPEDKQRLAAHVLGRLWGAEESAEVEPRKARREVFLDAGRTRAPREEVLASAAARLETTVHELERALFADLPGERVLAPPPKGGLAPGELALRCNLALVQGLLFRAARVRIEGDGNARAVVRNARLRGLICDLVESRGASGFVMELSGPLALFRRTLLYGRALASLVPCLAWCRRWRLVATVVLEEGEGELVLGAGDPIQPGDEPRRFDSRLEERFARDFRRAAPEWDLVREPEPVRAGSALIFPDFAIYLRSEPERRWLVEIAGFWTPGYLANKLARYRTAGLANLVLCVDEERACAEDGIVPGAAVVPFRRRLDPRAVLAAVERSLRPDPRTALTGGPEATSPAAAGS